MTDFKAFLLDSDSWLLDSCGTQARKNRQNPFIIGILIKLRKLR